MYKPRIVEFEFHVGTIGYGKVKVDTRLGRNGFYPGDIDTKTSLGNNALFLGISTDDKVVYALQSGSVLEDAAGRWGHEDPNYYTIKRHASQELIKQMKQV
jgi:hypothetical protein